MICRLYRTMSIVLVMLLMLSDVGGSAHAQGEHRATMLANEPTPLPGSLHEQHPYIPSR